MKYLFLLLFIPSISFAKCWVIEDQGSLHVVHASGFTPKGAKSGCPKDTDGKEVEHGSDVKYQQEVDPETGEERDTWVFDPDGRAARQAQEATDKAAADALEQARAARFNRIKNACASQQGIDKDICEHITGQ